MPIYEFECPKCQEVVESLQKHTDPAPTCDCEPEAPTPMKKKVSRSSFILKGGGWYKDGYS